MPCCTYLSDSEVTRLHRTLNDADLKEVLDDVNRLDGEIWAIERVPTISRRLFRRNVMVPRYSLYAFIAGAEWQVINFAGGATSLYTLVTKADILNYLNGYVGGWVQAQRKQSSASGDHPTNSG